MGRANLPILQRDGGRGSFRNRFRRMQLMEMKYAVYSEEIPSAAIVLKAALEPMLINASTTVMLSEAKMELRGSWRPVALVT